MKKSFLNIALIVLFILAMSSVNLSAPKYKVKTVLTGDQTGVAQEGVPGGVVSYVIEILYSFCLDPIHSVTTNSPKGSPISIPWVCSHLNLPKPSG